MKKSKILFFLVFVFIIFISFLLLQELLSRSKFKTLKINEITFLVEIAETPIKKAKGLSGRDFLPENQGMIFIYEKPDAYSFWMKEMKFPLDFIWIRDSQIVEITQNVKPEDYQPPKVLRPKEKVDMILEVNAGLVEKLNFKIGDKISFKIN